MTGNTSAPRTPNRSHKICPRHLDRWAVVYVRQSTAHQVATNRESTDRQYALADRAVELGCGDWRARNGARG